MYTIFFAGDLFDQKDLVGNLLLAQHVEVASNNEYTCILMQDWQGKFTTPIDVRNNDIKSLIQSDAILLNFDGTDLDSGTVVEFMIAKMLDIPAVLLRTDSRACKDFGADWNLMAIGYPRTTVVKHDVMPIYKTKGFEEMQRTIAVLVVDAFKKVTQEQSLLRSYEEIFSAYMHVIKMCGKTLEQVIPQTVIHEIITAKISKNIYSLKN